MPQKLVSRKSDSTLCPFAVPSVYAVVVLNFLFGNGCGNAINNPTGGRVHLLWWAHGVGESISHPPPQQPWWQPSHILVSFFSLSWMWFSQLKLRVTEHHCFQAGRLLLTLHLGLGPGPSCVSLCWIPSLKGRQPLEGGSSDSDSSSTRGK